MRRLHRLALRSPPHGGARLGGGAAPAGGSARVGPGKFLLRKTRSTAEDHDSSCEGKPVGRPSRPSFRVPLRGRLTVLHWLPFARLPGSRGTERDREKLRFNLRAACLVAASDSWPLTVLGCTLARAQDLRATPGSVSGTHESSIGSLCGPHHKSAHRTAKGRIVPSR
jgi:hypothetical protein